MKTNLNTQGHIIVFNNGDRVTASTKDAKIMFPHRNIKNNSYDPISIYRVSEIIDKGTYAFFDGEKVKTELPTEDDLKECLATLFKYRSEYVDDVKVLKDLGMIVIISDSDNTIITKDSVSKELMVFVEPKYLYLNNSEDIKKNPRYYSIYNAIKISSRITMQLSAIIYDVLNYIKYTLDEKQMMYILESILKDTFMYSETTKHYTPIGCTVTDRFNCHKLITAYYCNESGIPTVITLTGVKDLGNSNIDDWQKAADFMLEHHIGPVYRNSDIIGIDDISTAYIKKNNIGNLFTNGSISKSLVLAMSVTGFYSREVLSEEFLKIIDDAIDESIKSENEHIAYLKKCVKLGYKDPIKELRERNYKQYYNLKVN